jgi:soluble lytic murein transglycosylase-like protein
MGDADDGTRAIRARGGRLMAVPYAACMVLVAQLYALPPRVLPSIQAVEGGAPGTVSRNANGSEDLGVMQINSLWIGPLVRYTGADAGTVRERLILRPCYNIAAAGAILRTYLDEADGDLMRAVGNYHSHTPPLHDAYMAKIVRAATRLFVRPPTQ